MWGEAGALALACDKEDVTFRVEGDEDPLFWLLLVTFGDAIVPFETPGGAATVPGVPTRGGGIAVVIDPAEDPVDKVPRTGVNAALGVVASRAAARMPSMVCEEALRGLDGGGAGCTIGFDGWWA